MSDRKSVWDWAIEYCGDPASFYERGQLCLDFLREEGLEPHHRVLDLGCGALSQGIPLIRYLERGNYVGLDPNGILIEAALQRYPELLDQAPSFSWASDFDATDLGPFDYVIAHSVLSHVSDWQLAQALTNVRAAVFLGAVWLASYREDQFDIPGRTWLYPDVSYFRYETVRVLGWHTGWNVERRDDLRERMVEVAPNDTHEWLRLTATLSDADRNNLRLSEEERQAEDREILEAATAEWRRRDEQEIADLFEEMGE